MSFKLLQQAIESISVETANENVIKSLEIYLTMDLPESLKQVIFDKLADIDAYKWTAAERLMEKNEEELKIKDAFTFYYSID